MSETFSAAQMRAAERAAIESGRVTGLELMERAGAGVVAAVLEEWPELAGGKRRAVVLCGPGNNGGDGFVIARLLRRRGWAVELGLYGDAGRLAPDARRNYERWLELGQARPLAADPPPLSGDAYPFGSSDLLVDALFGTGLTRPLSSLLAIPPAAGEIMREHAMRFVAVDIPSGLCADSGRILGAATKADLTVTFHRKKIGHMVAEGPAICGKVVVADIGL